MGFHYDPNIELSLKIMPEKDTFSHDDNLKLTLDIQTANINSEADFYLVLLDTNKNMFSAFNWEKGIQPAVSNIYFPAEIAVENITLINATIPSDNPPIIMPGNYSVLAVTAVPGTFDLNIKLSYYGV